MNRLTRYLSRVGQQWRQRQLRHAFTRLGAGPGAATLRLSGRAPRLEITGTVELGEQISFRGLTRLTSISVEPGAVLKIGAYGYLNQGANLAVTRGLTLGPRCVVAEGVSFFDTNYHEVDEGAGVLTAPIVIGRNVWIGQGAIILPGTQVGDHSVIAAGAVVRGAFPARSLIAGVPARRVRDIRCHDNFFRR